ncbi:thioredoxin-disulfide reductase [Candidatus Nitrosocosmicus franklandus]|uniref:Thioredoxin reductase n=1 Tax=Candidatus Nitrosocosmicus franklandianus TaxID=1798806 RepID=A0A484IF16_9ARCH|nr:thioredoxin-disulfide reductase [Candidatus Nitrosocosmicus franklandus]VFJ15427.1 Thioredoxin reductase [Candidatus Nitrosocosmicus franklandus]
MMNLAEDVAAKSDDTASKNVIDNHFDVAIIGSGPAGYTASIYTSRAKLKTIIISGSLPGGQLMTTTDVENFPGFPNGITGPELMMNMQQQSERFGTKIEVDEVTSVDFKRRPFRIKTGSSEYLAKSVLISTGASPRKLGIKGESVFSGRGVSYCATCDGPFFRDQELLVVGGGDTALEEATFLTKFGKSVKVIHRRDKLRASKILQERAFENPKIEFIWNSAVVNIEGQNKVASVTIKNIKTGEETVLNAGGLFVAIGHEPNTALFKGQINLDERGYVIINNNTKTNIEGVFAAGDVHDHRYRQAITAAGFGCMAALDIEKWLSETKGK